MSSFNPTQKVYLYAGLLFLIFATAVSTHGDDGAFVATSLTAAGDGTVSFAWEANTEPDLAGYRLHIGTQSGVYSSITNVGLTTTYQLTGLVRGATYFFALGAVNTAGRESALTPEVAYLVPQAPPNAAPTLNTLANISVDEDSGARVVALSGISSGSSNEVQTLTVSATSSDTGLIPQPTVSYISPNSTGSITFQPRSNAFGTAMITATVNDGQLENNQTSQSFTVTVAAINDAPYFEPLWDIVLEQGTTNYVVPLYGIQSGAPNEPDALSVSATSAQPDVIPTPQVDYTSPATTALITLNPAADTTGASTITATVSDGQAQNDSFSRTFSVTIQPANTPPSISQIADQSMPKNRATDPIPFTVNDSDSAVASLQVTAASSDPAIIPLSGLILGGSGSDRTLIIDPINGRSGTCIVTLTVSDGSATTSMSFQVTVQ